MSTILDTHPSIHLYESYHLGWFNLGKKPSKLHSVIMLSKTKTQFSDIRHILLK